MATSVLRLLPVFSTAFFLAAGDLSVAQQPPPPAPAPSPAPTEPLPPVDLEPADERPAPAAPPVPPEQPIRLTFPNTSVTEILSLYEVLTGKRLVRDSALAQGAPLTIVVPGEVPKSEAIRLIEASLLLNGYTFVPVDENTQKILGPTKFPRSEGIPIFSTPYTLPASDQVVSYFMKFSYLAPEQAVQLFQTFVSPPKAYTSFTPVPNVQAVLITENVPVIRKLISLQAMVDVPPAQVVTEFVTLKRADAEKVVEVLQSLVEKRDEGAPSAPGQPGQPQVDAQGQIIQAALATGGGAQFESNLIVGETQLAADPRTNRILVVTRPVNMPYIKKLIAELDAPVPLDAVLERPLKFVSAIDVLPVLSDLLSDGETESGGATTGRSGGDRAVIEGGTGTGQGIGSEGGLSTGGGTSRPDRIREPTEDGAPQSIIVGKTKIIADKSSNTIIVIGPPDSRQKAAQLLDMLDVRPRQVYIAAVIGELNLSDEMEFGFSYFLRYTSNGAGTGLAGSLINPLGLDPGNVLSGSNLPNPVDLIRPQLFQGLQGLTVYGTIADAVDVYARALEETGKFKVLSRPVVYTSNNKKAVISSGQQVPFVSSTLASSTITTQNTTGITSNITYKDVLLKLEVLPLINANKDVTLVIVQTKNDVLRFENLGGNLTPIIGSQELTTTVTVPSGGTVVLGGLIVERMEAGDAGVPFLMRIPVLGYLFKQNSRKVQRQELLILLQPTVVENDADLAEASWQERYRSKIGDEAYAEAAPPAFANTPVVFDGQELESDTSVRKPRDPLRPAGWDYEEYAPDQAQRPRKKQKASAPQ
jgi:general secretion pathway protein D